MDTNISTSKISQIERDKLATVSEEDVQSQQAQNKNENSSNSKQKKDIIIKPLPLDEIMNHVSKFGMNLDNLENKLADKLDSLRRINTEQPSAGRNSNTGGLSNPQQYMTASVLQGV